MINSQSSIVNKSKVVFFGTSEFVIPIIEVLKKNFDLRLVITTETPELGSQGVSLRKTPVIKFCAENKIPHLSVSSLSDSNLKSLILSLKSSIAILADFGLIVPQPILNMFPMGIINIHPSLLPKYRGPTPVQTAILNGEKKTGVTIIRLDNEVDHGPILAQEEESIFPTDNAESLYQRLFIKGADLLVPIIRIIETNAVAKEIPQDDKKATFTKSLTRQDGYIDVSKVKSPSDPAGRQKSKRRIRRMIAAYYPWPGVWTKLRITSQEVRIKFLPGQKLQVEGKKPMSHKDFINGYPEAKKWIDQII